MRTGVIAVAEAQRFRIEARPQALVATSSVSRLAGPSPVCASH